jgi:anti-anti-sigma factor
MSPPTPAQRRDPHAPLVTSQEDNHAVIWLVGDQDLATVPTLDTALTKALELNHNHLIVDLSKTSFIDAATIGTLTRSRTAFQQQSRTLTLRAPTDFVGRILDLCGVTHLLDPNPTSPSTPTHASHT